jgi:hypothetical protein
MSLVIYPGADGVSTMYEDDGRSFGYRTGDSMRMIMSWSDADRRISLALAPGSRLQAPMPRDIEIRVVGTRGMRLIVFRGDPVEFRL